MSADSVFYTALCWAGEKGLITDGRGYEACSRADAVIFLWKLAGNPVVSGSNFKVFLLKRNIPML